MILTHIHNIRMNHFEPDRQVPETFKVPQIDTSVTSLKVQLCFVLDYTGSMKTQIAQAKDSVSKIIEAMQKMKIASLPNAAVDVEMAAVAYFDWDAETRKLGRPVVSVFGGREARGCWIIHFE